MKRTVFILTVVFLMVALSGCKQISDIRSDMMYKEDFEKVSLYYGDFSKVKSMSLLPYWMGKRIDYVPFNDVREPREVLESGLGDCDGFALVYMNVAYVKYGVKCDLAYVLVNGKAVVSGGKADHAVVRLPSGTYLHAQTGMEYKGDIAYIYTFDEVFF